MLCDIYNVAVALTVAFLFDKMDTALGCFPDENSVVKNLALHKYFQDRLVARTCVFPGRSGVNSITLNGCAGHVPVKYVIFFTNDSKAPFSLGLDWSGCKIREIEKDRWLNPYIPPKYEPSHILKPVRTGNSFADPWSMEEMSYFGAVGNLCSSARAIVFRTNSLDEGLYVPAAMEASADGALRFINSVWRYDLYIDDIDGNKFGFLVMHADE